MEIQLYVSLKVYSCEKSAELHKWNIPGDPEKSDPTQSVIEKRLIGRLKSFKRCSVAKRLACVMSIFCNFFRHGKFPELRILRKRACLESSKSGRKQGIDLQSFQIFKTMRGVFHFSLKIFLGT